MPEETAAAPAIAVAAEPVDSFQALVDWHAANDGAEPVVDNSQSDPEADPVPEEVPEPEAASEEPPEPEAPEDPEAEAAAEEGDDTADDGKFKPFTKEELHEKFGRSNTIAAKKYMEAATAEVAKLSTQIDTIGGEEFVEPVGKMVAALVDPDPAKLSGFFAGVAEAAGADKVVALLGQALYMGFERADDWAKDPGTAEFAEAIASQAEAAIQGRFGVSSDDLRKMAEWHKVGWFDKLDQWVADNYVPPDELDEMLEINRNPMLKKLAEENQELKKSQSSKQPEAAAPAEVDNSFGDFAGEKVKALLTTVVWPSSPLNDAATDSDDAKAQKAFLREVLERDAIEEFNKLPEIKALKDGFKSGKASTSVYRTDLTKALDKLVTATAARTEMAESILAKLHGQTRNAKLATPKPAAPPAPAAAPAVLPPVGRQPGEPKTVREITKELEQAFIDHG